MAIFSSSSFSKSNSSVSSSEAPTEPLPEYRKSIDSDDADDSKSGYTTEESGDFDPTTALQVEATGFDTKQALKGWMLENITVVQPDSKQLEYTSVRLKKFANSCALVRSRDEAVVLSTIYTAGPRRPRMRLFDPAAGVTVEDAIHDKTFPAEAHVQEFKVKSRSVFSRTQVLETPLGTFEWRYARKSERKAYNADNLLIAELTPNPTHAAGSTSKVRVAQLIRNDAYRTAGTVKYSGGNGGRLQINLRPWSGDTKSLPERAEALIVASCIMMLKREADRFVNGVVGAVA